MLSRQDRQRLEAIESGLIENDPRFAAKFDRLGHQGWLACRGVRPLLMGAVFFLATLALVCLVSGLPLSAITLGGLSALGAFLLRTGALVSSRLRTARDERESS